MHKGRKAATRVTVSFDEKEYRQLSAIGEKYRVSRSWIVRQAVSQLLERLDEGEELELPLGLRRPGGRTTTR